MGQVRVFPRLEQMTHLPMRSERGLTSRGWVSTNSGMMVLICVPLSKRAIQLSLLTLTLAMFLIPYHQVKGSGFKKGVWVWCFIPRMSQDEAPLMWLPFLEGFVLPSLVQSPSSCLEAVLPELTPAVCNHRWSDLGCHSDNSTSPPATHPCQPGEAYNELFSYTFNAI